MIYVTFLIILTIAIVLIIQSLIIKSLVTKLMSYSKWMLEIKDTIGNVMTAVDKIDQTGHFKTEDQIQYVWEKLRFVIKQLNMFVDDQEDN